MFKKGTIVISETVIMAFGIVVCFFILASMGSMIFSGEAEKADESALRYVAKDIAAMIDNVAGEAGSVGMIYDIPKGMDADVVIEYKRVTVTANNISYSEPIIAMTHAETLDITDPKALCIVKNQDDMKIAIAGDRCVCNPGDGKCDPGCLLGPTCDPDCNREDVKDNVCDVRCSVGGDGICDPDCSGALDPDCGSIGLEEGTQDGQVNEGESGEGQDGIPNRDVVDINPDDADIVIDDDSSPPVNNAVLYLTSQYSGASACIQDALNDANSGDTIYIREGDYEITNQVSQSLKDLNIVCSDNVNFYIKLGNSNPGFYFRGKSILSTEITSDADEGSLVIRLADTSGIAQGDIIRIYDNVAWCPEDYPALKTGETYLIESISGNSVTLDEGIVRDYRVSRNPKAVVYRPAKIRIQGCNFIGTGRKDNVKGVMFQYCKDSSITDGYFDDNGCAAIYLETCYNIDVARNNITDSNMTGLGYGVDVFNAASKAYIYDNTIRRCRHAITSGGSTNFGGVNRDVYIYNNELYKDTGENAVVDAHPATLNYIVINNMIDANDHIAFSDGTRHSIFSNNKVYNGKAINQRGKLEGSVKIVTDNYIENGAIIDQDHANRHIKELTITGNTVKKSNTDYGVNLVSISVGKVTISNNDISGVNYGINIENVDTHEPTEITVTDNVIEAIQEEAINLIPSSTQSVVTNENNVITH